MKFNLREFFFHPFLLAIYPVLSLFAFNLGEMRSSAAYRPLLISLVMTLIIFVILRLSTRNWQMAAVLTTFTVLLFFTYGHIYNFVKNQSIFGFVYGRHRILGPVWIISGLIIIWFIFKRTQITRVTTTVLNLVTLVLIAMPVIQIINYYIHNNMARTTNTEIDDSTKLTYMMGGDLPDIYYIILDRYSRADIILAETGYDNSAFTQALEDRGFFVARCSRSNYQTTLPSIASTLNMVYLDELTEEQAWVNNENSLVPYIRDNAVRRQLEDIGYHTVNLAAYQNVQWPDAEYFIDPLAAKTSSRTSGYISPFEVILLHTTLIRIILDMQTQSVSKLTDMINFPYAEYIQQQTFILDKIPELPFLPSPVFAYIHINIPHTPYVFGQTGELLNAQTVEEGFTQVQNEGVISEGYVGQVQFINQRILAIVDQLVANSGNDPIIIIQGDHGFVGIDADAILNAYLVPDTVHEHLYDSITPVNTFRILFSDLFNVSFPLLSDVSYLPAFEGDTLIQVISPPLPCKSE
jgi:hypothetical protein